MASSRPYRKKDRAYWDRISQPRPSQTSQEATAARLPNFEFEDLSLATGSADTDRTIVRSGNDYSFSPLGSSGPNYSIINNLPIPFENSRGFISVAKAIDLCQKAYYNVAVVRNTIELFVDLCKANIYFGGKNKAAKDWVKGWWNVIDKGATFQDQWYREYWRSGNVFCYRFDGELQRRDLKKVETVFGAVIEEDSKIAIRFLILNPINIGIQSGLLSSHTYFKVFSPFELTKLRYAEPGSVEEQILNDLPENLKTQVLNAARPAQLVMSLDPYRLNFSFHCRQSYEPLGVPFVYPALADIEQKLGLKKVDAVIAKAIEGMILLITCGDEPSKGGVNVENMKALQTLFKNPAAARVIIADHTTEAEWKIPDVKEIIGPAKYEQVDRDIAIALQNPLLGEARFADLQLKLDVLIERMASVQDIFVEEFLKPEIKRACDALNLKSYPTVRLKRKNFKDPVVRAKMITRLAELGIITGPDAVKAIETQLLPGKDDNLESQKEMKGWRDSGYFTPLIGGSSGMQTGRPNGTSGIKKSSNKVGIQKGSLQVSPDQLRIVNDKSVELGNFLVEAIEKGDHYKDVTDKQDFAKFLAMEIVKTTPMKDWLSVASGCLEKGEEPSQTDIFKKILAQSEILQCDDYAAALIVHASNVTK